MRRCVMCERSLARSERTPMTSRSDLAWNELAPHEKIDRSNYTKAVAYEKDQFSKLSDSDIRTLKLIERLHKHLSERDPLGAYGVAGGLHEFVTEILTDRGFQRYTNNIGIPEDLSRDI